MSRTDPAEEWEAVTPADGADLPRLRVRGVYSHDGGDISCVSAKGATRVFTFAAGEIKPICPVRIRSTGTTSTDISALY